MIILRRSLITCVTRIIAGISLSALCITAHAGKSPFAETVIVDKYGEKEKAHPEIETKKETENRGSAVPLHEARLPS